MFVPMLENCGDNIVQGGRENGGNADERGRIWASTPAAVTSCEARSRDDGGREPMGENVMHEGAPHGSAKLVKSHLVFLLNFYLRRVLYIYNFVEVQRSSVVANTAHASHPLFLPPPSCRGFFPRCSRSSGARPMSTATSGHIGLHPTVELSSRDLVCSNA